MAAKKTARASKKEVRTFTVPKMPFEFIHAEPMAEDIILALVLLYQEEATIRLRSDEKEWLDARLAGEPAKPDSRFTNEVYSLARTVAATRVFDHKARVYAVPGDFPVQPLPYGSTLRTSATCGSCGRSWDDSISTGYTPAPSGRCPFEAFHE